MAAAELYRFGPFTLDARERLLERDRRPIDLQPKVFDTLLYLVQRSSRLVSRKELLDSVWSDTFVTENALSRCIKEIRRALGDDPRRPSFVATLRRTGYRFIAEVRKIDPADSEEKRLAINSLAVLPFKPLLAEERDEALEAGMAETLIMRLSNIRRIAVRPLSAVRRYADASQDPLAAGREQNVDAVLDGSVQRSGQKLRVSIRLIDVRDGTSLWADQFDEAFTDVFAVQDSIADRIVRSLQINLSDNEQRLVRKHFTVKADAYRSYLIGRLHCSRYTQTGAEKAIDYFRQAIELDPQYALAYTGWAEAHLSLASLGLRVRDHYGKAKELAARALEIDEELGEAYAVLATVSWEHDWETARAEELFRKAIALRPNDAQVHFAHANFRGYIGHADVAIAEAKTALHIDPLSPLINVLLAGELYLARRFDQAIEQAKKTIEIEPAFAFGYFFLGLAKLQLRAFDEAIGHLEKARQLSDRPDLAGALGYTYAAAGRTSEARDLLRTLEELYREHRAPPLAVALIHLGLRELDAALDYIQKMADDRSWSIYLVNVDPLFDELRKDRRTEDLLRRAGQSGSTSMRVPTTTP